MRTENTRKTPSLIAFVCLLALGAPVSAEEPARVGADLDSSVRGLLQLGVEQMAPAKMWLDLGVEAVDVLISVVRDSEAVPLYRNRAVAALGHYSDARVVGFLLEFATSDAYSSSLRLSALATLAQHYPDQAMAPLTATMSSRDDYERRRAALTLGYMLHEGAGDLIRASLEVEKVAYVRTELAKALTRHLQLRARRNTEALIVTMERLDQAVLPSEASRWRVRVEAPGEIHAADRLLRIELKASAPEQLVFEGGNSWRKELAAGGVWELQIDTHKTAEDFNGSFRLFIQEEGKPDSERRIDVREE